MRLLPARHGRVIGRRSLPGLLAAGLVVAAAATGAQAQAQKYPERPVTIVAPFAPGGPSDAVARLLAKGLQAELGQTFVVDNRPGAGGNIGIGTVTRSTPDGYTLLLGSSAIPVNAAIFKKLSYDPLTDLIPITEVASSANVIVVHPSSAFKTLADLIAHGRQKPGALNYASAGVGSTSHLTGELFKLRTGLDIAHVPYRGAGPAVLAVMDRTTEVGVVAIPAAEQLINSGQLRALAVTGKSRWQTMPNVPTAGEAGISDFVSETFSGLFAPAGTPDVIIGILADASRKAMQTPEARKAALAGGLELVGSTPAEFKKSYLDQIERVKALVAEAGIPQR
jgi:tripartite-type tricarboxylate transporter receptor subunit TctC